MIDEALKVFLLILFVGIGSTAAMRYGSPITGGTGTPPILTPTPTGLQTPSQTLPQITGESQEGSVPPVVVSREVVIARIVYQALPSIARIVWQKEVNKVVVEKSAGRGFIVDKNGLIVTNKRFVADTDAKYFVVLKGNKRYAVVEIYRDPLYDLAVLKIKASNLSAIAYGDSSKLQTGDPVVAVGTIDNSNPRISTAGAVTSVQYGVTSKSPYGKFAERLDNIIRISVPVDAGKSGGPLLDIDGKAVGVNTATSSAQGFVIPASAAAELTQKALTDDANKKYPYTGIRYFMISQGAYVYEIVLEPGAKSILSKNDVITKFNGEEVKSAKGQTLGELTAETKPGQKVKVEYLRKGEKKSGEIQIGGRSL